MNALYTVIENGHESYFGTNIANGFSYPFVVFSYAERMAKALNENEPLGTVGITEMFPLMKANKDFPEKQRGERIFSPLSEEVFFKREAEMAQVDYTSFSITLDFDERKIGFVFNQNDPELPRPKIEIRLDKRDAREAFGKENPLMDAETFYRIELGACVLESPVFLITLQSDKNSMTESALLPLSYHDQRALAEELKTESLDNCRVISVVNFNSTFNTCYLNGQPFSKLNRLAEELNKLRLDCGDAAFNSVVKASKTTPFHNADSAMTAVDNVRKNYALQETQGMNMGM